MLTTWILCSIMFLTTWYLTSMLRSNQHTGTPMRRYRCTYVTCCKIYSASSCVPVLANDFAMFPCFMYMCNVEHRVHKTLLLPPLCRVDRVKNHDCGGGIDQNVVHKTYGPKSVRYTTIQTHCLTSALNRNSFTKIYSKSQNHVVLVFNTYRPCLNRYKMTEIHSNHAARDATVPHHTNILSVEI